MAPAIYKYLSIFKCLWSFIVSNIKRMSRVWGEAVNSCKILWRKLLIRKGLAKRRDNKRISNLIYLTLWTIKIRMTLLILIIMMEAYLQLNVDIIHTKIKFMSLIKIAIIPKRNLTT